MPAGVEEHKDKLRLTRIFTHKGVCIPSTASNLIETRSKPRLSREVPGVQKESKFGGVMSTQYFLWAGTSLSTLHTRLY